jgi:hypothetical protein
VIEVRIQLREFDSKGEIVKTEFVKSKEEGLEKAEVKEYWDLHECLHDEIPWGPCRMIKKKHPVVAEGDRIEGC